MEVSGEVDSESRTPWPLLSRRHRSIDQSWLSSLILDCNAIHVASSELPASSLSGFFVEPSEAGTIENLVTPLNAFGERMARRKGIARFKSSCAQMLPC